MKVLIVFITICFLLLFTQELNAEPQNDTSVSSTPALTYDTDTRISTFNEDLIFSAASSCLPDQYTFNYSDPDCHSCPNGKYRSIPSQFAAYFPMSMTWGGADWTYSNRIFGGYAMIYPVYYTPYYPYAGGGGCAWYFFSRWNMYYSSGPSIDADLTALIAPSETVVMLSLIQAILNSKSPSHNLQISNGV